MIFKNEKGSAIAETLPAVAALLIFVAGILLGTYLIFARAWMQYQSEQTLYCLGESKPAMVCRRALEKKLVRALPWGRLGKLHLSTAAHGRREIWKVEVEWKIRNFSLRVQKELGHRHLLQSRALHW